VDSERRGKTVVGFDGRSPPRGTLRCADRQAELTGRELEAITTWELPTAFGWAPPHPEGIDPESDTRRALNDIVRAELGPERAASVRCTVVEGHAAPVLADASAGADLLLVGSRGHGAFVGMLLGWVSEHCVSHAACPVVVVREQHEAP
jgi:nucleotide-binding universal stress UspA family protein